MEWSVPRLISFNGTSGYGYQCTAGDMAQHDCSRGGKFTETPNQPQPDTIMCDLGSAAANQCSNGGTAGAPTGCSAGTAAA